MALIHTPVCDFGWPAPDFTLSDPAGKSVTLSAELAKGPVLIAFLCNHCPYVQRIAQELANITTRLAANGITTLGVMSNDYRDYPSDAPDKMQAFAAVHGWTFPYLVDEGQSVGRAYDAQCTPDFYGLAADGGLQYRGRVTELEAAMLGIKSTGRGPDTQTPSMGCSIKWSA